MVNRVVGAWLDEDLSAPASIVDSWYQQNEEIRQGAQYNPGWQWLEESAWVNSKMR